jgi:hypothetical protein
MPALAHVAFWLCACTFSAIGLSAQQSDLSLSNNTLSYGPWSYYATNSVRADQCFTINNTANVTFTAGNFIHLGAGTCGTGFHVTGTGGAVFHASIFSCSASPNPAVVGQPVSFNATTPLAGASPFTYSWSGSWGAWNPGNVQNAQFTPGAPGTYVATVTVSDQRNQHSTNSCSVTVGAGPDFTIGVPAGPYYLMSGGSVSGIPVTITPLNGFSSQVTLSAASWPPGLHATFQTNPSQGSTLMTIRADQGTSFLISSSQAAHGTTRIQRATRIS